MNILGLILLAAFFIVGSITVRHMDRHPTWARNSSVSAAVRDRPRTVGACVRGVLESGAPLSNEALALCRRVAAEAHVDRNAVGAKHALRRQMRAMVRAVHGDSPIRPATACANLTTTGRSKWITQAYPVPAENQRGRF